MKEQEIATIFKQYDEYLDTLLGLDHSDFSSESLHKFRNELREGTDWRKDDDVRYLIEAKTFLKFLELCQKKK